MSTLIETENIKKSFGKYSILESISLQIEAGTVYGLVGLNGAGKTTLLRLLLGLLKPDGGSISILGMDPWTHQQHFYKKVGVVLEHDGFWGNMSPRENLDIYAAAKGVLRKDVDHYLAEYWSQTDLFRTSKKAKHLSRGQKMQCALCRAFLGWSSVYFLDEPALALDMNAYEHFCSMVNEARNKGAAVIISSHQLDTIDTLCTRVGILRDKHLSDLQRLTLDNEWIIVTDENREWKTLIEQCGGRNLVYEQGWKFTIEDEKSAIPAIIQKIVMAGGSLQEVRKITRDTIFSNVIRDIYCVDEKRERLQ